MTKGDVALIVTQDLIQASRFLREEKRDAGSSPAWRMGEWQCATICCRLCRLRRCPEADTYSWHIQREEIWRRHSGVSHICVTKGAMPYSTW